MEDNKDFKLPSTVSVEKQKEQAASETVLVLATKPCYVNNIYHVGGERFVCEKATADTLVASKSAIIEG